MENKNLCKKNNNKHLYVFSTCNLIFLPMCTRAIHSGINPYKTFIVSVVDAAMDPKCYFVQMQWPSGPQWPQLPFPEVIHVRVHISACGLHGAKQEHADPLQWPIAFGCIFLSHNAWQSLRLQPSSATVLPAEMHFIIERSSHFII